jgi:hypothetical protein
MTCRLKLSFELPRAKAKANEALTVKIREFYDQSMGIYGSPRVIVP